MKNPLLLQTASMAGGLLLGMILLAPAVGGVAKGGVAEEGVMEEKAPDIRGRIPLDEFVIQAHRGGGSRQPENTLETCHFAWRLGVVPEVDIRQTKDGVVVAFHDKNFKRLVKGASPELQKKSVETLAWNELKQLDVGAYLGARFAGRHPPKVSSIFAAMRGHPRRWLYLDIKKVALRKLADMVKEHDIEKQVIMASTHHKLIREWKKLVPRSQTLLWMGGSDASKVKRFEELEKADFEGITSLQIHVKNIDLDSETKPFTPSPRFLLSVGKTLRSRKITFQSLPWGCSEAKVYHKLMDLGVESFASDSPEVTLKAVRDYYEHKDKR
ncbi:MAG: glycerophosphodiester phosphodiesterase family protein [Planctomycetota bacterium]|nr:glycerophosphodiester phosphodiesterase family protein [Planctomycetota bacterium]